MMKQSRRAGFALAMVVIIAFVLSVLAGALYTLFRANVESHSWNFERIQARYTAEAAANLTVKMIMGGADVPQGITPLQFLPVPPTVGWYSLPGEDLGQAVVWVDPSNHNPEVWSGDAYGIRALGRVADAAGAFYTYGMETVVVPENFCRFATFLNQEVTGGYYGDGYRFDGPFFCNGAVCLWSGSASSTNDIWFYKFGLAVPYYYYSTGSASNPQTTPIYGNLTIQPTQRMQMGAPYFELGADSIPFGPDEVNWQDTRTAAMTGGLWFSSASALGDLPDGTRMILTEDTLMVKTSTAAAVQKFWLGGLTNHVVWIDNDTWDRVYLKTMPPYVSGSDPYCATGLSEELTIGMNGDFMVAGPTQYQNRDLQDPDNTVILGILSVYGDFVLTNDPTYSGAPEWADPWKIVTDGDLELDATVMVLSGDYVAENPWAGPPGPADFLLMGGYIVDNEGITTISGSSGWDTVIYFDPRLLSMHPPFFPQTGRWDVLYWAEKPGLNEDTVDDYWF
jgi:hypothetical protein